MYIQNNGMGVSVEDIGSVLTPWKIPMAHSWSKQILLTMQNEDQMGL